MTVEEVAELRLNTDVSTPPKPPRTPADSERQHNRGTKKNPSRTEEVLKQYQAF